MSSRGDEAAELAAASGLNLSEEQRLVLHGGLGVHGDGRYAAFEVATVQPRRTGKSYTLEALILLALKDGKTIAYTSVRVDSAQEVFHDLVALVERSPVLAPLLEKVTYANGKEGIWLSNGGRCVFGTRSSRTGRGFGLDLLVLDEAMILAEQAHNALIPATSAQERPQIWYAGTAVDESDNEHGVVLSRIRARAISGEAKNLSYTEWSVDLRDGEGNELRPEQVTEEMVTEEMLREAQPGWGTWIQAEQMAAEREAMGWRGWLNERCGIGAWTDTSGEAKAPITGEEWNELCDPASKRVGQITLVFDSGRDRRTALMVCGRRSDELLHPELIRFASGSSWLREQLADMVERYDVHEVVYDDYGGNRALAASLGDLGVRVRGFSGAETVAACTKLLDLTAEKAYRHIGQPELLTALRGAKAKTVGDAWAWKRKDSSGDAAVVVALTLALAAGSEMPAEPWDPQIW